MCFVLGELFFVSSFCYVFVFCKLGLIQPENIWNSQMETQKQNISGFAVWWCKTSVFFRSEDAEHESYTETFVFLLRKELHLQARYCWNLSFVQKITSQIMIPRSGLNVQFWKTNAKLSRLSKALTILYLGQQVCRHFLGSY